MKRNLLLWLVDNYIKKVHRITKESVSSDLADFKTNKDKYIIPKWLNFPRKIEFKFYLNIFLFVIIRILLV